jgi:hypothetical protein
MSQIEKTKSKTDVDTRVAYLPAPEPFTKDYPPETTLATVRVEAMSYFGVQDYNDRDRHEFQLEHDGQRVDYSQTVAALADSSKKHHGEDDDKDKKHKKLRLDLVEQVTAGGR